MKKKLWVLICILVPSIVLAINNSFSIDYAKLIDNINNPDEKTLNNFEPAYAIDYKSDKIDPKIEREIISSTKKVISLLFGQPNNLNESVAEFMTRKEKYGQLVYGYEYFKSDDIDYGDENVQKAMVADMVAHAIFSKIDEIKPVYQTINKIVVRSMDEGYLASVYIPDVEYVESDLENPIKYIKKTSGIEFHFWFIKFKDEYRLYYMRGQHTNKIADYFNKVATSEENGSLSMSFYVDSDLKKDYDFSKLNQVTETQRQQILNNNVDKVLILNTIYDKSIIQSGLGFIVKENIIVTTWSYLEHALNKGQMITIKDHLNNYYELEGIITGNIEADLALLKIKGNNSQPVRFSKMIEDPKNEPIFTITTKTGINLSLQSGITINSKKDITNVLPLSLSDQGSPLFNLTGEVVGYNTTELINQSLSISKPILIVQSVLEKLDANVKYVPFTNLKEKYYKKSIAQEIITNTIPEPKWKEIKKIGNLENTINFNLLKANYSKGAISLRYENSLSGFMDSMTLVYPFRKQLIQEGYKEVYLTKDKSVYENSHNRVIILAEFNYLIVMIVGN